MASGLRNAETLGMILTPTALSAAGWWSGSETAKFFNVESTAGADLAIMVLTVGLSVFGLLKGAGVGNKVGRVFGFTYRDPSLY